MFKKTTAFILFLSSIGLWFLLNYTNPTSAGPAGILLVFVLIYVISTLLLFWLMIAFHAGYRALNKRFSFTRKQLQFNQITSYYYATAIGLSSVLYIGISSVSNLNLASYVLILAYNLLAIFYINKRLA